MNDTGISTAGAVRKAILASRSRFWRPTDFPGSPDSVAAALSRLYREGELRRVRRGLYWRGRKTLLGMAPPSPEAIAHELAGSVGVGPAELSAAAALGLTTQVPPRTVVATPGRPPSAPEGVRFVDRSGREGRTHARLRPNEVALLEVLEEPDRFIELDDVETVSRLHTLFSRGVLDASRVCLAAHSEPARVRERLQTLFQRIGEEGLAEAIPGRRTERHRRAA
jgi:hypothetical protein